MNILFIIAQQGFRDEEYFTPKEIFENKKASTTTASLMRGECVGKLGKSASANLSLEEVNVSLFDAIVFVGGPGALTLQQNKEAHRIAKQAQEQGKVIGAICIAPTILAYAGVLKGKKVTAWNNDGTSEVILREQGAKYVEGRVEIDENLVTASGPEFAQLFAKKILDLLQKE